MRISDWSSDVCSSDLPDRCRHGAGCRCSDQNPYSQPAAQAARRQAGHNAAGNGAAGIEAGQRADGQCRTLRCPARGGPPCVIIPRSEEQTSELQSIMRISNAVFSLQNTTTHTCDIQEPTIEQ